MGKPRELLIPTAATSKVVTDDAAFGSLSGATFLDAMHRVLGFHGPPGKRGLPKDENKPGIKQKRFVEIPSPPSHLEGRDGRHLSNDFSKKLRRNLASLMDEGGAEAVFKEAARMAATHGISVASILQSSTDYVGVAPSTMTNEDVSEPVLSNSDAPAKATPRKAQVVLPELPKGLSWPSARYKKHSGIVDFLKTSGWKELIAAGYGELRFLRQLDPHAAMAISTYESPHKETGVRRRLPKGLQFLRERDVTDKKILSKGAKALRTDGHLAAALAARVARGSKIPRF